MLAQVSMHLRGPMNVSQLAVYQLPADVHTLRKRKTVPFYNRRRALHEQDASTLAHGTVSPLALRISERTTNSRSSCSPSTVTATVTVTECDPLRSTSAASMGHDTASASSPARYMHDGRRYPTGNSSLAPHHACTNAITSPVAGSQPNSLRDCIKHEVRTTERSVYPRAASDWSRVGYYTSAAPAQATGLSFLANLGDPQRSGTFD